MKKSSKQLSVSSVNLRTAIAHGSPVNTELSKSLITKLPSLVKKINDVDLVIDSNNVEISSVSNSDTKIFTAQTGLPSFEPTIVVSSEFIPLYYQGNNTDQGNALKIKENSKIVNAKVSVEMLSQSEGSKQAVSSSKEELREYIGQEDTFLSRLMFLLNSAHSSMNISSYVLTSFFESEPMGSLYEILKKGGYSSNNIVNFTETKLWQQSLVELKRSLLSHTPDLVSENFTRSNIATDSDPFLISDVESPPRELKRIWLNPYYTDLPDEQDLYSKIKLTNNVDKLLKFCDSQYVNLTYANSLRKTPKGFATENLVNAFERSIFSQKVLDPYVDSGRDVSIIANCLFKEANYSSFLTKKENSDKLLEKYDFQISDQGDNLQLWDYVVGRFPKSVLDVVKSPTGNRNSLVSFSQEYIEGNNNDYYNVLTLEDNYLENSDITPGSFYYIDSSLITLDGKSFDLSRIDHLIEKTKSSHESTKTILDIMGYDSIKTNQISGYREKTLKRKVSNELDFDGLVENLSMVGNLYQKYVRVATYDQAPVVTGFDINSMKLSNFNDSLGIRLAALICKAAVSPTQGYKTVSNRLKVLLFLWIMNFSFLTSESVSTESEIKNKITELLTSIKTRSSEYEIEEASREARTFPFKVGSISSINGNTDNVVADESRIKYSYEKSVGSRVFNLTASTGLWSKLVEVMRAVYQNTSIFINEKTAYSGFSKVSYLFGYFDLMLKLIAAQTPEDLLGSYSSSYKYATVDGNSPVVVSESGLIVSNPKYLLNGMFNANLILKNQPLTKTIRKLSDISKFLKAEENLVMREVLVYRRYLLDLGTTLQSFRDFLSRNFEDHLTKLKSLYDQDGSLSEKQKIAILNLTFTEEQVKLSRYVMSEILDRINVNSDTESKLRSIPSFSTFPEKFTDFLPVRETDLVSYTILSKYFSNTQFLSNKGENKRILSVGIPPKLNRAIRTSSRLSVENVLQGLVRIKVFKIDKLLPDVIYQPQSYVFDMNRFPTRVMSNWDYDSFFNEDFNILRIPSKLILSSGEAKLHRDFNEAFPEDLYGNSLTQQEKLQIYANHSISLLSEEYMRWFTDCKFDETRYNNYSQLSNTLQNLEDQYIKYLNLIKQTPQISVVPSNENTNQVAAEFFDPTSGKSFQIPVKKPGYKKENQVQKSETNKSFVIPLDKSLRSYFLNETFLSNTLIYKKMISYPKKFDRVFSIIVDPDDFYVDETMTSEKTLSSLKSLGLVSGGKNEDNNTVSPYKTKEKDLGDVSLIEYFVTVEPFDYVQEYEG